MGAPRMVTASSDDIQRRTLVSELHSFHRVAREFGAWNF